MAYVKRFSLTEAFRFGFSTVFDNVGFYAKIVAVTMIFHLVVHGLCLAYFFILQPKDFHSLSLLFGPSPMKINLATPLALLSAAYHLFCIYLMYQYIRVSLQLYKNKKIDWKDFFTKPSDRFFTFLLARLWLFLKVLLGFFLLVIPGIYIAVKNYFVGFSIADEKTMTVREDKLIAQKLSFQVKGKLLILFLVNTLLSYTLLGVIFLPFTTLASVHAYKQLMESEGF